MRPSAIGGMLGLRKSMGADEFLEFLTRAFGSDGRAWALAWARALPVIVLVPAFGLSAVALPIRVALAATMAVCIAPALRAPEPFEGPFALALAREAARGLPVALAAAAVLWAAVMAGGLADNLRGARENSELPVFEEPLPAFSALLGLLVAIAFLQGGGAERLALTLAEPRVGVGFAQAAERLSRAVGLAVAIAAPLLAGSILIEMASAFIARAAAPAYVQPALAPLRSLAILFIGFSVLDRTVELLVLLANSAL